MNWLEWVAAGLGVVNVALVVRRSVWNYPFGLAMVSLYFFVFFEAKLYSDALLQIFFFVVKLYGWRNWVQAKRAAGEVPVGLLSARERLAWAAATLAASLAWGLGMARFTDAAAPIVDAGVAGFSIAAQILMARRKLENWVLWIAVDIVAIGLYASRGLALTARALCPVPAALRSPASSSWRRALRAQRAARMTRGFVLGKFMPPHAGHVHLCETARRLVDQLTILVCWLPDDPIPGPLRLQWMRAAVSRLPGDRPRRRRARRRRRSIPISGRSGAASSGPPIPSRSIASSPARLMASGWRQEVGAAEFVLVGPRVFPDLSGSAVRADPWAHWDVLPRAGAAAFRPHDLPARAGEHRQDGAGASSRAISTRSGCPNMAGSIASSTASSSTPPASP